MSMGESKTVPRFKSQKLTKPISQHAKEYAESSSLHGIKYIAEDGRHPFERILWIICCLACVGLMFYLIYPIYLKWVDFPTITTLMQTNHPIYKVDFPAVTICSNNKFIDSYIDKLLKDENGTLADISKSIKEDPDSFNETKSSVIDIIRAYTFFDETDPSNEWSPLNWTDSEKDILRNHSDKIPSVMRQVMQKCNNMIMACEWQGKMEKCSELFSITRTDAGFCCSFNMVRPSELIYISLSFHAHSGITWLIWNEREASSESESFDYDYEDIYDDDYYDDLDGENAENSDGGEEQDDGDNQESDKRRRKRSTGTTTKNNTKTKLKRTNSASSVLGLNVMLYQDRDDYFKKDGDIGVVHNNYYGFKVLVHDPYQFPLVSARGMSVGIGQEAFISVSAQARQSDKTVKKMTLKRRKCISHDEDFDNAWDEEVIKYKPKFFSHYTMQGCIMECRAEYSLGKCGCVPYYYPEFSTTKMCSNVTQLECLSNISATFYALGIKDESIDKSQFLEGQSCDCMEDCDQTLYSQEQSQGTVMSELMVNWLEKKYAKSKEKFYNSKGACCLNTQVKSFVKERDLDNSATDTAGYGASDKLTTGMSIIHVYFKELEVVLYTKQENFGIIDLIAAFGGLVGLCIGFSFLSGVEFIYFFTIRLLLDRYKK